jgi:hypothetical protein
MRRLHVAVTTALALAVTGLAIGWIGPAGANHQFPDVATGSAFHDAISDFVDAGCATGFPNGTYHPTDPVNRQQIARMFSACGGRVDFANDPNNALTTAAVDLAPLTVTGQALGSGQHVVLAIADIEVRASGAGLPCEVIVNMLIDGAATGPTAALNVIDTSDAVDEESASLLFFVPIAAGQEVDLALSSAVSAGPVCGAAVTGNARLAAVQLPFGSATGLS